VIVSRHDCSAANSRVSAPSRVTKPPVVDPLSVQALAKCFFRNSFVLMFLHFSWGVCTGVCTPVCTPLPNLRTFQCSNVFPNYPLSFHILAHSFARTKDSTCLLSSASALFAQNDPGWGVLLVD
jgi:hypothetical protein